MDSDCPQLGATIDNGLINGMCGMDSGGSRVCRARCAMTTDCPAGMTCGTDNFCM
jgi:hypothetical protein